MTSPASPTAQPRRLLRSKDERMFAGVAGGLAEHFNLDPLLVRLVFLVTTIVGGVGGVAYVAAWLLVPEVEGGEPVLSGGRTAKAVAILAIILIATIASGPTGWVLGPGLVTLALAVLAAVIVWRSVRGREAGTVALGRVLVVCLSVVAAIIGAAAVGFAAAAGGGAALAIVTVVIGVLLLAGAFAGGVRWMILPGIVVAGTLAAVIAAGADVKGGVGERSYSPVSATDVAQRYSLGVGQLSVDLRGTRLPDGDTHVALDVGMGNAVLYVPDNLCVSSRAGVGAGYSRVFGRESGGIGIERVLAKPASSGRPRLVLDAHVGMGALWVIHGKDELHGRATAPQRQLADAACV